MNLIDFVKKLLSFITKFRETHGPKPSGDPAIIVQKTVAIKATGYVRPDIQQFIDKIRPAALAIEAETGIPWRFAMVQSAHESRYGQSQLTVEANNLFGITGESWQAAGKPVYVIMTTEYDQNKVPYKVRRPFRKYANWEESLRDWADLLTRRYPKAVANAKAGDFEGFAQSLAEGGYATDPKYATKLASLNTSLEGIA